jgi:hypothetical protein
MSDRVVPRARAVPVSAAALLLLSSFASTASAQFVPIPLHVVNPTAQARTLEPVSFGVPVPQVPPVFDAGTLVVRDASLQLVPAQMKVLSRWGADRSVPTAPLKWVLVTLRPTIAANATADFTLEIGAPPSGSAVVTTSSSATAITVTTATGTSFVVPINTFAPFSQATVGGQNLLSASGSLDLRDPTGAQVVPSVTSPTVVEDGGAVRVVLRQRGTIGGLKYTCRWYFHAGRADVALDFRLENSNAYGLFSTAIPDGQVYFDKLALKLPVAGTSHTVTSALGSHVIPTTQVYDLRQDFGTATAYNVLSGFVCTATIDGSQVSSTGTYAGSLDVTGPNGGVTVTVERFWQNFPKALKVQAGVAEVSLFPEWGHGPEFIGIYEDPSSTSPVDPMALTNYRFEGGRWKTHHVVFDFHGAGARTTTQVANEATRVNRPLVGHAEPSVVRKSFATGNLVIERGMPPAWTSVQRYNRFYDMMVDDNVADSVSGQPKIGLNAFINRGGTWGDRQPFGWENYGDLPWADGYCDLHYNWPANLLLEFLRTGDWRFYDRGRDMAAFRRDYGQHHGTATSEPWRGCQFFEKGWWHGNNTTGGHGHNWALGTLLHYAITGDEGSREAALENADFCVRNSPAWWSGWWGSRIPGRAIEALVDAYTFLGDPNYLTHASSGVYQFQSFEIADGMHGYHLNPANGTTAIWMDNVFYTAAAKYVLASGDNQYLPFLGRMRDWFKQTCIIWPAGPVTNSTMPLVYDTWAPPPATGNTLSVQHGWEMVEALSYSAVIHADLSDLDAAGLLFEGLTRFWQVGANFNTYNANNGFSFSAITMRPMQYPSTESKVLGIVLNSGNPYLTVRSFVLGNW